MPPHLTLVVCSLLFAVGTEGGTQGLCMFDITELCPTLGSESQDDRCGHPACFVLLNFGFVFTVRDIGLDL